MPINSNLIYHNSLTKIMRRVRETPGHTENFFRCLNCSKLHQFKICLHSKEKSANRNCKFFRNLEMAWLLCTECSYKTPKQYNLTRHMEKHTKTQKKKEKKREREKEEEKIFECKHCKKSMKDKGILKTHENKQHGYSCSMCDDKFLTKT